MIQISDEIMFNHFDWFPALNTLIMWCNVSNRGPKMVPSFKYTSNVMQCKFRGVGVGPKNSFKLWMVVLSFAIQVDIRQEFIWQWNYFPLMTNTLVRGLILYAFRQLFWKIVQYCEKIVPDNYFLCVLGAWMVLISWSIFILSVGSMLLFCPH